MVLERGCRLEVIVMDKKAALSFNKICRYLGIRRNKSTLYMYKELKFSSSNELLWKTIYKEENQ